MSQVAEASDRTEMEADMCEAAVRIVTNHRKLEREKKYQKASGVLNKDAAYRAGRGEIEGRETLIRLEKEYKEKYGKEFDSNCPDYFE